MSRPATCALVLRAGSTDWGRYTGVALRSTGDPEFQTCIAQCEMAFHMQASVPELVDDTSESQGVLDMFGEQPGGLVIRSSAGLL